MYKKSSAPKLHHTRSTGYFREDAEEITVGLAAIEADDRTAAAFIFALVVVLGESVIIEVMSVES